MKERYVNLWFTRSRYLYPCTYLFSCEVCNCDQVSSLYSFNLFDPYNKVYIEGRVLFDFLIQNGTPKLFENLFDKDTV